MALWGEWCRYLHCWSWETGGYMGRTPGTPPLRSRATAAGMNSEVITSCRADGPLMWLVQVLALVGRETGAYGPYPSDGVIPA